MKFSSILIALLICFVRCSLGLRKKEDASENNEPIVLNALVVSVDMTMVTFNYYVDSFNKYSKENNLNIKINIETISELNSTYTYDNMSLYVGELLKKKKSRYDIFFLDNNYTSLHGPYLLDIGKYLPKEHVDMYNKKILSQIGIYKGKLVALPATICFNALFSNVVLLNKYNKPIPKTWSELVETSKYILEQERLKNNTDLVAYNGLYDNAGALYSLTEFIYSCRDSYDSPFPELDSETAVNALELIKKIKDEISSDAIYSSWGNFSILKLFDNTALFIKMYYMSGLIIEGSHYEAAHMPGIKEGIYGTALVGYNIGIIGSIDEKKLMPAVEAVKYMTSRKIQKELVLLEYIISGISSLYEEEDICSKIRFCDLYRDPQAITVTNTLVNPNEDYSKKILEYLNDFLFKNGTTSVFIEKVQDLTKVYSFSFNPQKNSIGLIIFIVYIVTLILIIFSILLLQMGKVKSLYLSFLPESNWFIIIMGILMILSAGFTKFGTTDAVQCHLYCLFFSVGLTFIYVPILHKLIKNFPVDDNKYLLYIKNNGLLLFLVIIIIDLILNALTIIKPFQMKRNIISEGKNYWMCTSKNNIFLNVVIFTIIGYKILFALVMFLFIFMEWNLEKIKNDLRFIVTSMYMNIFGFFVLLIFSELNVNNYIVYYLIIEMLILIITLSNFTTLYLARLLIPKLFKVDETSELFENFKTTTTSSKFSTTDQISSVNNGKGSSILSKILIYHKLQYSSTELTKSNLSKTVQLESNENSLIT